MITVGMLKQILSQIPDEAIVKVGAENASIVDYVYNQVRKNDIEKQILSLSIAYIPDILTTIVDALKTRNEPLSVTGLINLVESNALNDYGWQIRNIDENIRKMIVYKLQYNFTEIKNALSKVIECNKQNCEEYWSKLDYFKETIDKII